MSDDPPKSRTTEVADDVLTWAAFADDGAATDVDDAGNMEGGLEIDDGQAQEIRRIFLTTLPQYLEPVEQMVGQLLESDSPVGDVRDTLEATLASLSAAASRIGFEDVREALDRLSASLSLVGQDGAIPARIKTRIQRDMGAIRELTGHEATTPAPAARSRTIVQALEELGGVEERVLRRLTTAGLVTVDQLVMADPDEIVAVSGLEPSAVARLLALIDPAAAAQPATDTQPVPQASVPIGHNVVPLPVEIGLQTQLADKQRATELVEREVAALRAEIRRLQSVSASKREELRAARSHRQEGRATLLRLADAHRIRVEELRKVSAARKRLLSKIEREEEALHGYEERILQLRRQQRAMQNERTRIDAELARLVESVENMLESAQRG